MKIVVIGAGAMGSIYGGRLSAGNEVYIVDTNQAIVDKINSEGLKIDENGTTNTYYPKAVTTTEGIENVDLVILFVKAIFSRAALEDLLKEFVNEEQVIIGTTEDNGAVLAPGHVRRGGEGKTNVGLLTKDTEGFLPVLKETFDKCGFQVKIHDNIQQLIWDKLFTNVSLSAVTGILQVDMGYIAANEFAWKMTVKLIHEAVETAAALGLSCNEEEIVEKVRQTSENNPSGCTSIRADLRDGRRTEVDTISGAVVRAAARCNVKVPTHEFVVNMVHAMEGKGKN